MKRFYKVDGRGQVRVWSIYPSYEEEGFYMHSGVLCGEMQEKFVHVEENSSGRDIHEQIDLEVASRVKKKVDLGYKETVSEARKMVGRDANGNLRPMLAHKYDPNRVDWSNAFVQYKYDGHRCLIEVRDGRARAYTRRGLPIRTIGHILDQLGDLDDCILDGELYVHGEPLQTITSLVKRVQPDNQKLRFILYDMMDMDASFQDRLYEILRVAEICNAAAKDSAIKVALTERVTSDNAVQEFFALARERGYEGAIVRISERGYEPGKRSRQTLKVKKMHDDEFKVVDISESADGWAILHCETDQKHRFRCSAPGNIREKKLVLKNREQYIGRKVTVEYSHWTDQGTPFHPVAVRFQEDI